MFLELPISGLHRLFNTVPSSSHLSRERPSLESLTEESHTYELLYPDYEALLDPQHKIYPLSQPDPTSVASTAGSYDDWGDLDIQSSRDVRLLIAQDGNALAQQPRILFDSHPPASPRPPSGAGSSTGRAKADIANEKPDSKEVGQTPRAPGKISNSLKDSKSLAASQSSPSSPESDTKSAFWSSQNRRNGIRYSVIEEESTQARFSREGREETDALLGCMFGQTGLPLVSSIKLHINPPRSMASRDVHTLSKSPDPAASRLFPKKRTPLTRSMTAEDFQNSPLASHENADTRNATQHLKGPSILITQLFSVDFPMSSVAKETKDQGGSELADDKAKQIKVPKYGVAILIQLPAAKRQNIASASQHQQRLRLGTSHEESDHLAAVRDRLTREAAYSDNDDSTIIDQDVERIVAHWSVLTRVVALFEAVARSAIIQRLRDLSGHELAIAPGTKVKPQNTHKASTLQKKHKQPSQRTIQLPSQALRDSMTVSKSACEIGHRVASALKTRRVKTGQGRWGVWREEARWVGHWAGSKEQNFFLFNLLTAFLGNHTEWLESLRPSWSEYRRIEKTARESDLIKHRTVVVSADKMAARRLVFLLSAFLPRSYVLPQPEAPGRPLSSRSSTGLSRSPPAGMPIPRERSLRRTINRKPRGNRNGSPVQQHERSISFNTQYPSTEEDVKVTSNQRIYGHSRRTSDTRSVRSLALPIPTSDANTRKSSVTTTSTFIPDSVPVPHFASPPTGTGGTTAAPRPGSSGSLASLSLRRTLSRSESNAESLSPDSPSASRWGSMLSGFWSTRRGSSTDRSDPMGSPREGLGISGLPYSSSPGKLAKMITDLDTQSGAVSTDNDHETLHGTSSPGTITEEAIADQHGATAARDIPERAQAEEFPMKLSIDTNDGVVDIDLPTADSCSSSVDSSMSSPKASKSAASSFNDHSSIYGRTSHHKRPSLPTASPPAADVAGYLKSFHPDFALQAVRPYKDLKKEIKASMKAEATSDAVSTALGDEIYTTLIADTTTFTITRLSLCRQPTEPSNDAVSDTKVESGAIIEEPLMDLDPTLIAAVERVIAHSQPSSETHSRAPSPARQHPAQHDGHTHETSIPQIEVSRNECRALVLGALEQVARSVTAEQQSWKERGVGVDGQDSGKNAALEPDSTLREGVRRWLNEVGRQ
ncbi:MAG: hypothetical protein Q9195_009165 [Heterodermia aff. obscurata]